jgi:hypothetical protein
MLKAVSIIALAACSVPQIAQAKPIALVCTFMPDGMPDVINLTLNPDNSEVVWERVASHYVTRWPASFGSDVITFSMGATYVVLDRTTLKLTSTIRMINATNEGKCRKAAASKTAV